MSTHVLDTANGCPAKGIKLSLYRLGDRRELIRQAMTNDDGRTDQALLQDDEAEMGHYELVFEVADYFKAKGAELDDPPFLDRITLSFAIAHADRHYHVPLLVSPWSYSTYRGS